MVYEGQFDVIVHTGSGTMVLHSYSAGDHANSAFGELALVSGQPHTAQIAARTDGEHSCPWPFTRLSMALTVTCPADSYRDPVLGDPHTCLPH